MTKSIPLIRSGAIGPIRRWLLEIGRDERPFLQEVDLEWVPRADSTVPIPLLNAVKLLAAITREEGPDAPYRMVGDIGAFEIGLIGAIALQGPTVGEGLRGVSSAMRNHCTHELFVVSEENGILSVMDGWSLHLANDAAVHAVQQYDTAIVDMICSTGTGTRPNLKSVNMIPHPEAGLSHLRPWLGDRVSCSQNRALTIRIEAEVADQTIPKRISVVASKRVPSNPVALQRGATLGEDVATLVTSMLPRTKISLARIARAAGVSARTFRRQLEAEGTGFFEIVDSTRLAIATGRLSHKNPPTKKALARELGYANQETLTRAMHRWASHA